MKVQCFVWPTTGRIQLRADDERTIAIDPAWWAARKVRDNKGYLKVPARDSTEIEIRNGLFEGFYALARRYLKNENKSHTPKFKPDIRRKLLPLGRRMQDEIALCLENQGLDLTRYHRMYDIEREAWRASA